MSLMRELIRSCGGSQAVVNGGLSSIVLVIPSLLGGALDARAHDAALQAAGIPLLALCGGGAFYMFVGLRRETDKIVADMTAHLSAHRRVALTRNGVQSRLVRAGAAVILFIALAMPGLLGVILDVVLRLQDGLLQP